MSVIYVASSAGSRSVVPVAALAIGDVVQADLERRGNRAQGPDVAALAPGLKLGKVALADLGQRGEVALREVTPSAQRANRRRRPLDRLPDGTGNDRLA